jgi:large subunit ribosomal protein L9
LKGLENMKVLLIKDVYKLGHAGDVKKVADGYGRNYLIPQGLAVLATPGAVKQAEHIRKQAAVERAILNKEMSGVADIISDLVLTFPAKAGETGKLYGSVTTQMIADAIKEETEVEVNRRDIDTEPIRNLGEHKVNVRLTVDLIPEITVIVHRESEKPTLPGEEPEEAPEEETQEPAASEAPATEAAAQNETADVEDEVETEAPEAESEAAEAETEVETAEEAE